MTLIFFNWFRTHGKLGCGKMTSPGAAEFYLVYGEFHHHTWSW